MPTTTLVGEFTLVNVGPLTSTFSAPSSCASVFASHIGLAPEGFPFHAYPLRENCELPPLSDCIPSGSFIDGETTSVWPEETGPIYEPIYYYSPAGVCPSGWSAMGSAARNADGELRTSWNLEPTLTDFFLDWATSIQSDAPTGEPLSLAKDFKFRALAEALGPAETGIACCPNRFNLGPGGTCYKTTNIDSFTAASTVCEGHLGYLNADDYSTATTTVTLFGGTIFTAEQMINKGTASWERATWIHEISDDDRGEHVIRVDGEPHNAVAYAPVLFLAATGTSATGNPTSESGQQSTGTAAASETAGNGDSAAVHLQGGIGGSVVLIVAAWTIAMVVGGAVAVRF